MTKTTVRSTTERARHAVATATQALKTFRLVPALDRHKRTILFGGAALGVAALQVVTAGPAAVATVPTAFGKPGGVAFEPIRAGLVPQDPTLISTVLGEAFPAIKIALPPAFEPLPPPAAEPKNQDELMDFGAKRAPRWLVETILKAAHATGVDPVYLMTLADVESSLEPRAKAPTSTAEGLFQFIDRTWLEVLHDHGAEYGYEAAAAAIRVVNDEHVVVNEGDRNWVLGLKRDPYLSALMAGELINDIQRELRNQGERELAEAELYLAHFFGAKAAIEFLTALDVQPEAAAAKLFPKAAKANLGLFTERAGRRRRSISVAELYERIDSKIVRRLNRYDSVVGVPTQRAAVADALSFAPTN
jgi:Transglycosylase SLT domain